MRSWIGFRSALASVTMMVKLRIGSASAPSFGSQCSQRPAKAKGSPSARVMRWGCLGRPLPCAFHS